MSNSSHIEHCTLKGLKLSTLAQQMQCYMANFWLQLISPFSCTNIAHSAYCTHSIYSAISWRFPNGFRLSALAEISLQFRFCMAIVCHKSHCSQFGISRDYWIATNTCTVPHLKRRNKVEFWQTIEYAPQPSHVHKHLLTQVSACVSPNHLQTIGSFRVCWVVHSEWSGTEADSVRNYCFSQQPAAF